MFWETKKPFLTALKIIPCNLKLKIELKSLGPWLCKGEEETNELPLCLSQGLLAAGNTTPHPGPSVSQWVLIVGCSVKSMRNLLGSAGADLRAKEATLAYHGLPSTRSTQNFMFLMKSIFSSVNPGMENLTLHTFIMAHQLDIWLITDFLQLNFIIFKDLNKVLPILVMESFFLLNPHPDHYSPGLAPSGILHGSLPFLQVLHSPGLYEGSAYSWG